MCNHVVELFFLLVFVITSFPLKQVKAVSIPFLFIVALRVLPNWLFFYLHYTWYNSTGHAFCKVITGLIYGQFYGRACKWFVSSDLFILQECNIEEVPDEEEPPPKSSKDKKANVPDAKAPSLIFKITSKVPYKTVLKGMHLLYFSSEFSFFLCCLQLLLHF